MYIYTYVYINHVNKCVMFAYMVYIGLPRKENDLRESIPSVACSDLCLMFLNGSNLGSHWFSTIFNSWEHSQSFKVLSTWLFFLAFRLTSLLTFFDSGIYSDILSIYIYIHTDIYTYIWLCIYGYTISWIALSQIGYGSSHIQAFFQAREQCILSLHGGELLKKFAAAYRMFSDMDEPVPRRWVRWEGETRWVTTVKFAKMAGHVMPHSKPCSDTAVLVGKWTCVGHFGWETDG